MRGIIFLDSATAIAMTGDITVLFLRFSTHWQCCDRRQLSLALVVDFMEFCQPYASVGFEDCFDEVLPMNLSTRP